MHLGAHEPPFPERTAQCERDEVDDGGMGFALRLLDDQEAVQELQTLVLMKDPALDGALVLNPRPPLRARRHHAHSEEEVSSYQSQVNVSDLIRRGYEA